MGRPPRVTREQVLSAAREAFARRGYAGTTLAQIASDVGVSPAALLRHAPTKEALFTLAMGSGAKSAPIPIEFLDAMRGTEDPREVLRRVAHAFVPFMESQFGAQIARWQFRNAAPGRSVPGALPLPFDPSLRPTPPERALGQLAGYLRRAARAGRIRVKSPRAAALSFLGSLQAYVFFHRILHALDPPLPLPRYVETLVEIWTTGAVVRPRRRP
jgi:AcrR family transcriptional regulator